MTKTRKILLAVFAVIILALLASYIAATDFSLMASYMAEAPSLIPLLLLASLLGHLSGTAAWRLVLGKEAAKVSLSELFFIRLICENLTVFNPTNIIAGDGLKGIFLSKKQIDNDANVGSILLSRVLLIVTAILLMVLSMVYLLLTAANSMPALAIPTLILMSITLMVGLMYLLLHKDMYLHRLATRLQSTAVGRWLPDSRIEQIAAINASLCSFYRGHKVRLVVAFLLSAFHWVCGAAEFYLILTFFDIPISALDALVIEMGVMGFKAAGSMIPGQLGVEEYGNKVMLNIAGILGNEIWLIVSLLRRGRQVFWLLVTAPASMILYKKYKVTNAT